MLHDVSLRMRFKKTGIVPRPGRGAEKIGNGAERLARFGPRRLKNDTICQFRDYSWVPTEPAAPQHG